MRQRHLYVISSEFQTLARKTGLAEFDGLAAAIQSRIQAKARGEYAGVSLIMPFYPSLAFQHRRASNAGPWTVDATSNNGLRFVLIPLEGLPSLDEHGRISGPLPLGHGVWEEFAEKTLEVIQTDEVTQFDLLAIDWPTGPVVRRIRTSEKWEHICGNAVFTIDLLPIASCDSMNLWRDGVLHADLLHVPSTWWWRRIQSFPQLGWLQDFEGKVRTLKFGFSKEQFDPSSAPQKTEFKNVPCTYSSLNHPNEVQRAKTAAKKKVQKRMALPEGVKSVEKMG